MKSLFVLLFLMGQLPGETPSRVITGIVTEYKSSQGISGVRINLEPITKGTTTGMTGTSDSAGNFSFKGVAFGSYKITADRDGYSNPFATQESGSQSATVSTTVTLAAGLPGAPLLLSLARGGDLTGQVLDANGRPVSKAAVGAYSRSYRYDGTYSLSENYFSSKARSITDDKGTYRISGLPPGPYYVAVTSARGLEASNPQILRTFYPDSIDPERAIPIQVLAGQEAQAAIKMPSPEGVTISGTVIYSVPPDIIGPQKPTFYLMPRSAGVIVENPRSLTDVLVESGQAESKFEVHNVLPGSYDLIAVNASKLRNLFIGRTTLEVGDKNLENVVVRIHPGSQVKIRLVVNGAPSTSSPESLRPQLRSRGNLTTPFDTAMIRPGETVGPRPKGDPNGVAPKPLAPPLLEPTGAFSFLYVAEGSYAVEMMGLPEDAYIADVKQGGFSDGSGLLTITDVPVEEVQVLISTSGTRVEGDIVASSPANFNGVDVVLIPQGTRSRNASLYKRIAPDEQGHLVLRGVAPGEYRLYAMTHLPPNAHLNAEFMQQFNSQGVPLFIQGGAIPAVKLKTIEVLPSN
jgi:hypothetical protein